MMKNAVSLISLLSLLLATPAMAQVLKTRNTEASLNVLHGTMSYCISCYRSFRQ